MIFSDWLIADAILASSPACEKVKRELLVVLGKVQEIGLHAAAQHARLERLLQRGQLGAGPLQILGLGNPDAHAVVVAADAAVADLRLAQRAADVAHKLLAQLVAKILLVDFEQHVGSALEVESKGDGPQPVALEHVLLFLGQEVRQTMRISETNSVAMIDSVFQRGKCSMAELLAFRLHRFALGAHVGDAGPQHAYLHVLADLDLQLAVVDHLHDLADETALVMTVSPLDTFLSIS